VIVHVFPLHFMNFIVFVSINPFSYLFQSFAGLCGFSSRFGFTFYYPIETLC